MNELKSFLERMGGLHDAVVRQLIWAPEAKTLRLEVDDLCSNFEGLPEYPGAVSGAVELRGIQRINFAIDSNEKHLNIYEFIVEAEKPDEYYASISFWPSGQITASYCVADFPDINLRQGV